LMLTPWALESAGSIRRATVPPKKTQLLKSVHFDICLLLD
jgi:hypothetical protein